MHGWVPAPAQILLLSRIALVNQCLGASDVVNCRDRASFDLQILVDHLHAFTYVCMYVCMFEWLHDLYVRVCAFMNCIYTLCT
jgi:hypothetical protein